MQYGIKNYLEKYNFDSFENCILFFDNKIRLQIGMPRQQIHIDTSRKLCQDLVARHWWFSMVFIIGISYCNFLL